MKLLLGDAKEKLKELEDNNVDMVATDPPYQLDSTRERFGKFNSAPAKFGTDGAFQRASKGFMGKKWDVLPNVETWAEVLRVMKPGAFAFILMTPRQDSLARCIVDLTNAGFNTGFTSLYWTYASGFPKAHNISKSIDKKFGAEREVIGKKRRLDFTDAKKSFYIEGFPEGRTTEIDITIPATEQAKEFDGAYGGYQPKPAVEVILVAMKPMIEPTYVDQVLDNGKGCTWMDDCRIPYKEDNKECQLNHLQSGAQIATQKKYQQDMTSEGSIQYSAVENVNTIISGKENGIQQEDIITMDILCCDEMLMENMNSNLNIGGCGKNIINAKSQKDMKSTTLMETKKIIESKTLNSKKLENIDNTTIRKDINLGRFPANLLVSDDVLDDHSKFFSLDAWAERNLPFLIVPKTSKTEKNKGCENIEPKQTDESRKEGNPGGDNPRNRGVKKTNNNHPTVKTMKLMSYLITMGSRPGDIVLDPFMGSATTGCSAVLLDRDFIGIELDENYMEIAKARIDYWQQQNLQTDLFEEGTK